MTVSLQSQTVRVQGENQDKKEHKERESHIESRGSLKDLTFVKVVDKQNQAYRGKNYHSPKFYEFPMGGKTGSSIEQHIK